MESQKQRYVRDVDRLLGNCERYIQNITDKGQAIQNRQLTDAVKQLAKNFDKNKSRIRGLLERIMEEEENARRGDFK